MPLHPYSRAHVPSFLKESIADPCPSIGLNTPRAASPPSTPKARSRPGPQRRATSQPAPGARVRFNLSPKSRTPSPTSSGPSSPAQIRKRRSRAATVSNSNSAVRGSHHEHGGYDSDDPALENRSRRQHRSKGAKTGVRDASPAESDSTIEMPERFDRKGQPLSEEYADRIESLFAGKGGGVGKLFRSLGLGGGGGGSEDEGDGSGGRRRRHRR